MHSDQQRSRPSTVPPLPPRLLHQNHDYFRAATTNLAQREVRRDSGIYEISERCGSLEPDRHAELSARSYLESREHDVDPTKKYERKPRRKTRSDRYDYKVDTKKRTRKHSPKRSHELRRGRRLKNTNALYRDFKAPNVDQDRITLQPGHGPGIFNRGKTAASNQRQGIPDLTFSDMSFLRHNRNLDEARLRSAAKSKPKKKAKVIARQIHGRFEVAPEAPASTRENRKHGHRKTRIACYERILSSKSSPAKLDLRRSLSIPSAVHDTSRALSPRSPGLEHLKATKKQNPTHVKRSRQHQVRSNRRNDRTKASSYVSCSASPSPEPLRRLDLQEERCGQQDRPLGQRPEPIQGSENAPMSKSHEPLPGSVSDLTVDSFTRRMLLNNTIPLNESPKILRRRGILSLEELKDLARIDEPVHPSPRPAEPNAEPMIVMNDPQQSPKVPEHRFRGQPLQRLEHNALEDPNYTHCSRPKLPGQERPLMRPTWHGEFHDFALTNSVQPFDPVAHRFGKPLYEGFDDLMVRAHPDVHNSNVTPVSQVPRFVRGWSPHHGHLRDPQPRLELRESPSLNDPYLGEEGVRLLETRDHDYASESPTDTMYAADVDVAQLNEDFDGRLDAFDASLLGITLSQASTTDHNKHSAVNVLDDHDPRIHGSKERRLETVSSARKRDHWRLNRPSLRDPVLLGEHGGRFDGFSKPGVLY